MLRAWFRLFAFAVTVILHFSRFLIQATFSSQDRVTLALKARRRWIRFILPVLGIDLQVKGTIPIEAGIVVSNHLSYLDPIGVLADTLAWPVAKAEVSKWPLIGKLAKDTGILYVKRESKDSRTNTAKAIVDALKRGLIILNYPEGTTQPEPVTLPFKKGAFRIAAAEGFPIYPVAVLYSKKEAAWIADDTFLPHFMRTFRHKHLTMYQSYGPPMEGEDAEALLARAQNWIDAELQRLSREHTTRPLEQVS